MIENSKKPIVSAINGTCYGLGVEMSLACQARICSDDPRTKLALPEVKAWPSSWRWWNTKTTQTSWASKVFRHYAYW